MDVLSLEMLPHNSELLSIKDYYTGNTTWITNQNKELQQNQINKTWTSTKGEISNLLQIISFFHKLT